MYQNTYNNSKVKLTISKSIQGFAGNDPLSCHQKQTCIHPINRQYLQSFNLRHSKGLYAIIDATAPSPVPVTKSKHMLIKSN